MLDIYSLSADPNPTEIIRIADVLGPTGLRRTMLYDLIGKARFPAQVNLGARAVGWYKREVLEWICSRSAKHVSGSARSSEGKTSAVLGTTSKISKTAAHKTEVQKKQAARNKTAQRLRKEVGDIRVHGLPTRSCGSEAAMDETEELQQLQDENARLKQLVEELFLKNSILREAASTEVLRHHQEWIGNAKAPITKGHPNNERKQSKMDGENRQERFVDADAIARSLGETRRYVLYLARTGAIRSYPMCGRERIKRKFLLSEVRSDLVGRKRKIRRRRNGAPITAVITAERKPK